MTLMALEPMSSRVLFAGALPQERLGHQALNQVEVPPIPFSPADSDPPGHEERLEHGTSCRRRRPPPVDGVFVFLEGG